MKNTQDTEPSPVLKIPPRPPQRFHLQSIHRTTASIPLMNCIPPRTVCTSLSPSLREVPLPEGEARAGCRLQTVLKTGTCRSVNRCPPSPWLSLRESWREAPERAHCTVSADRLPSDPLHRFLRRNCIPARTVYTSLSPSLREVPLPEGEARGWVQTSNSAKNRELWSCF